MAITFGSNQSVGNSYYVGDSTYTSTPPWYVTPNTTTTVTMPESRCAKSGHELADEAEYVDGSIVGTCQVCGEVVRGRRLVGGIGVARLRAVMLELLAGGSETAELLDTIASIKMAMEIEEQALREAEGLLRTAESMLLSRRRHGDAAA